VQGFGLLSLVGSLVRIGPDPLPGRQEVDLGAAGDQLLAGVEHLTTVPGVGGDYTHAHLGTTGAEWLSRDPAVAQAFIDDPLTTLTPLQKLFGMADAARLLGRPARGLAHDLPVLIQVGCDDPLGGPVSARRLERAYRTRSRLSDVTTIIYDGARHEIFNETNRAEVFADLTAWLTQRFPART